MPENELPIEVYKGMLYDVIKPIKPKLNVIASANEQIASISSDIDGKFLNKNNKDHEIIYKGFNIYLPISNDNIICNDVVIVHESGHLFDFLCSPKLLLPRGNKFIEDSNADKFNEIVEYVKSDEYKPKKILGLFKIHSFDKELREKLKGLSNEFIIELLQRCRYSAELEVDAYKEMTQYALKTNPVNLFYALNYFKRITDRYEFKHKKQVCEKLLKEYLQLERSNHDLALQKMDKNR